MSTHHYEYWPFITDSITSASCQESPAIAFLQSAHDSGFTSFRFGINDYGARSREREGCILERGRTQWEVRLAEGSHRQLLAYVDDFPSAGQAVTAWLNGATIRQVMSDIQNRLITPPGANVSHVVAERRDSD